MQTENTATSFQALVKASRAAGRLAAPAEPVPKKKMVQSGMRLWPEEMAQATELAAQEERSGSFFMRRMYLRGLAAYMAERDGKTVAQ